MIGAVDMKVGKKTHKLKFGTAAMMRMERENAKPVDVLLDQLITGKGGVSLLVSALAAGLGNGQGVEEAEAVALVDAAGGARKVIPFVSEAITAAFPAETGEGGDGAGNGEAPGGA